MEQPSTVLSLELEICLFALAIALVRHIVTLGNFTSQFSALELASELNTLTFGQKADFYINPLALQHGIHFFKLALTKMSLVTLTKMSPSNGEAVIGKYYSLPSILAGYDITYCTITTEAIILNLNNEQKTLNAILEMHQRLFEQSVFSEKEDYPS